MLSRVRAEKYEIQVIYMYSRAPVSTDSASAVSVIRGLPRLEKKIGKLKKETVRKFQTRAERERAVTW
jgi:hypothetical protein